MATLFKTQSTHHTRGWSLAWLGRLLMLVPEMLLLPLLFGLYLVMNQALIVAFIGELVFLWFVARTGFIWLARRAWLVGKYQRAERFAQWSLRLYSSSADAWAVLSTVQLARGNVEMAINAAERAIALFPHHASFHLQLSQALTANHQWHEARHVAMTALSYDDTHSEVHAQIAQLSMLMHEPAHVVQQWVDSGLSLRCDQQTQVMLYLARAEAAAQAQQPRLAHVSLDQITTFLPDCPIPLRAAALYRIGRIHQSLKNHDAARHAFEQIELLDAEGCWLHAAWRAKVETSIA